MDLYDIAVARKLSSGGGGDITVESLTVTENNTYTAPTGKAYSPVVVNVSGGGGSDFSTASVTIASTNAEAILVFYSTLYDEELNCNVLTGVVKISGSAWTNEYEWAGVQNTNTEVLFLSDNTAFSGYYANSIVCTGDAVAVYDDEYSSWTITVTGNCTITIS